MTGALMAHEDNTLGRNVRRLREALRLTQAALAAKVGVTPQSIWNIETGRTFPRPVILQRVADALGVDAHDLMRPPLGRLPAELVEMTALAKAAGLAEPTPAEIEQLLAMPLRGRATAQAFLFLLMALRAVEPEGSKA